MADEKVALITGGSRGIGRSAALHLAQRGVGIILTFNTHKEDADAVLAEIKEKGGKAVALQLDMTKIVSLEVFTMYIAREFASRKIRANIIAPGALDTQFGGGRTDQIRKMIADHTLQGRIGNADDIGVLIAGLLSDDSRWINGQRIEATGGVGI